MKPQLICAYLYADGHAVLTYEKEDKDAGKIEFAEIHEKLTSARLDFQGRIIFSCRYGEGKQWLKLAQKAKSIRPSNDNGSQKTKEMNLHVQTVAFRLGDSRDDELTHTAFPDILCSDLTYQETAISTFAGYTDVEKTYWGGMHVSKIHSATKPE
jgi:hypothetical protein